MSGLMNKVKEAIRGDRAPSSDPDWAARGDKLDPAAESGSDGSGAFGNTASGYGTQRSAQYGTADAYGGSTNTGPHSPDVANKLDPSDLDGSRTVGNTGGEYNTQHGTADNSGSTNAGPHRSNVANKVDSSGSYTAGNPASWYGTHATPGTGNAPNTAGPHKSDFLNKLDPRVDSNLDASKTTGGSKTHTSEGRGLTEVDTHDAAKVPPSVFAAHHGEPVIAHDDHKHNRAGRHGSVPVLAGPDNYGSGTV